MRAPGPWFFPVTPFGVDGAVDHARLRAHVASRAAYGPELVVAAGGAGEFSALAAEEVLAVVRTAADAADGTAVYVGTGGPLGHALQIASQARRNGASGILVLPPYLVPPAGDDGLVAYVDAIVDAAGLPAVVYHRGTGVLTPAAARRLARSPLVVGIKDGFGDLALLGRIREQVEDAGRDLLYLNGMPTAELHQDDYDRIGVRQYSSALFTVVPQVALAFRQGDPELRTALRREVLEPFAVLRDETPGHAVSLIKAGLRLRGDPVGPVRPPLVDPTPDQQARLAALLDRGTTLIAGARA